MPNPTDKENSLKRKAEKKEWNVRNLTKALRDYNRSKTEQRDFEGSFEANSRYKDVCRSLNKNYSIDGRKIQLDLSYDAHMKEHFRVMNAMYREFVEKGYMGGVIYDLGCGTAHYELIGSPLLANIPDAHSTIIGIDNSPIVLLNACKKIEKLYHFVEYLKKKGIMPNFLYKQMLTAINTKFYQKDILDLGDIVAQEGAPDTVIVSYCFHWLNNKAGCTEKAIKKIHSVLKEGGYFISIDEWPWNIGFNNFLITDFVRENTKPIRLEEELYQLIRQNGFEEVGDTIIYNIERFDPKGVLEYQKLRYGTFTPKHEMYGKVFRKV